MVSKTLLLDQQAEEVLPYTYFRNKAHLMLHLPILALLLAFYHHYLLVRIQSPISLKSHSFLAAKEGSDFPVS